jgi:hypothetical protein
MEQQQLRAFASQHATVIVDDDESMTFSFNRMRFSLRPVEDSWHLQSLDDSAEGIELQTEVQAWIDGNCVNVTSILTRMMAWELTSPAKKKIKMGLLAVCL